MKESLFPNHGNSPPRNYDPAAGRGIVPAPVTAFEPRQVGGGCVNAQAYPAKVAADESAGVMLTRLGDDAMKWAEEFRATAIHLGYSDMPVDWLVGWFANAIEHSSDVRRWRAEAGADGQPDWKAEAERLQADLDARPKCGNRICATCLAGGSKSCFPNYEFGPLAKAHGYVPAAEVYTLRTTLPCGHPKSLALRSVESPTVLCELCEARAAARDAETMEASLRAEVERLKAGAAALFGGVEAFDAAVALEVGPVRCAQCVLGDRPAPLVSRAELRRHMADECPSWKAYRAAGVTP